MKVVNGNPAISYYDFTNSALKYVRAADTNGSSWGGPGFVDSIGNVGRYTSLAVVNGNPAISYWNISNDDLKYVLYNPTFTYTYLPIITKNSVH